MVADRARCHPSRRTSQVGTVDHCIRIWAETYSGCLDSNFVAEVDGSFHILVALEF